jgi:hypothetical protein
MEDAMGFRLRHVMVLAALAGAGACLLAVRAAPLEGMGVLAAITGAPAEANPAAADLLKAIEEAAKLPGCFEGHITEVAVMLPATPPVSDDGRTAEAVVPQDADSQIAGHIVTIARRAFRCGPNTYVVDEGLFQVTRAGPQEALDRQVYWCDGTGAEQAFTPGYVPDHTVPGGGMPTPYVGLKGLEQALQVDIGLEAGPTRYWLRLKADVELTITPGEVRQGLACTKVSYETHDPIEIETAEWICPDRGYKCVERVRCVHPQDGSVKVQDQLVTGFTRVGDSLWVPSVAQQTVTRVPPNGAPEVIANVITTTSGVRPCNQADLLMKPLLPNGAIVQRDGQQEVVGDDTSELETQLRAGQLPPPLPLPDLTGEHL